MYLKETILGWQAQGVAGSAGGAAGTASVVQGSDEPGAGDQALAMASGV